MSGGFRTISREGNGYYEEKRSKFLSKAFRVTTEAEVEAYLNAVRKAEYGANHHCYAYVLGVEQRIQKCSDDGEPQKTAGMPILNVLSGKGVTNCLIVVSRYFGGTLLGTGGLVRAYESAARSALEDAGTVDRLPGVLYELTSDYGNYQKIQKYLRDEELTVTDSAFSDVVSVTVAVPEETEMSFSEKVTDLTQGTCTINRKKEIYYSVSDGKASIFERGREA